MSESAFSFGPLGAMTDLVVAPAVAVVNGRELKTTTTSRGVRWAQRARRNPRTWTVSRPWRDPAWARLLSLAAHGVGGDMWLYDRACARQNMLPATASVGTGASITTTDGPLGSVTWTTQQVGVIPGRTYTISGWSGVSGTRTLTGQWRTKSGTLLGSVTLTGVSGLGSVTATAPVDAAYILLSRVGSWTGVRVHEGVADGGFFLTEGTPSRVAVADPQRTYQMITDDATATDYEVTIMEVG